MKYYRAGAIGPMIVMSLLATTSCTGVSAQPKTAYIMASYQGNDVYVATRTSTGRSNPLLLFAISSDVEVEYHEGGSFSFALGYHITQRFRGDIGFTQYNAKSDSYGIVVGGNGQVTNPRIEVVDIPFRVYYDLRNPSLHKRWNFHVLGLLAYANIRNKTEIEVFSGGVRSITRVGGNFNTLIAGAGVGLRYRLVREVEPFFDLNVGTGVTKGVFKGNGIIGVKINFI